MGLFRNQFCGTLGGARAIHVGQVWFLDHVSVRMRAYAYSIEKDDFWRAFKLLAISSVLLPVA